MNDLDQQVKRARLVYIRALVQARALASEEAWEQALLAEAALRAVVDRKARTLAGGDDPPLDTAT
jgi:hypothetical protein